MGEHKKDPATPVLFSNVGFLTDSFMTLEFDGGSRQVHKELICRFSPFFERALNGSFQEGQQQCVKVEANPDVVANFLNWLYSPHSIQHNEIITDHVILRATESDPESARLLHMYCFAEKYHVPLMKSKVLDKIHDHLKKHLLWSNDLLLVTTNIPEADVLFRILVYCYALYYGRKHWTGPVAQDADAAIPVAFWLAVLRQKALWEGDDDRPSPYDDLPSLMDFHANERLGRPVHPDHPYADSSDGGENEDSDDDGTS